MLYSMIGGIVVGEVCEKSDVLICLIEFESELLDVDTEVLNCMDSGIVIQYRFVFDVGGFGCVVES